MKFDIIGDIHGHADQLRQLLKKLGYKKTDSSYTAPSGGKAIFVGDFIDRGPKIRETLEIVKSMCDRGTAWAVLGNHEYNALCYHTHNAYQDGDWLRPHTKKNILQHQETVNQFEAHQKEWQTYLAWFMRLPLFIDLGDIRIVHAAWVSPAIEQIRKWTDSGPTDHPSLRPDLLQQSAQEGSEKYKAFETVLKGVEIALPTGCQFKDKEEHSRTEIRIRWWESAANKKYGELIFPRVSLDCSDNMTEPEKIAGLSHYSDPVPVFFGHYWRNPKLHRLKVQTDYICCLDYSIAKKGRLVAYRWEGEKILRNDHFESVQ